MKSEKATIKGMKKTGETAAVVLAAGLSSRMGEFKQLLPIGGQPAVCRIVDVLIPLLHRVVVVVGHRADEVEQALGERTVLCVRNEDFRDGMLSSVQCAVHALGNQTNYLICLGDQPSLAEDTVATVLRAGESAAEGIVVPTFAGKRGHPLFLHRRYHQAIIDLPDGVGLNALTRSQPQDTLEVPMDRREILEDMDTPQDYQREAARGCAEDC